MMGVIAAVAAWREGAAWVDAVCHRIREARDRAMPVLQAADLPCALPEATYLLWCDARRRGWPDPAATVLEHGVGLSDGAEFGAPGWLRLNLAAAPDVLDLALRRIAAIPR